MRDLISGVISYCASIFDRHWKKLSVYDEIIIKNLKR